jgi:AcrR family transcriptional regulator
MFRNTVFDYWTRSDPGVNNQSAAAVRYRTAPWKCSAEREAIVVEQDRRVRRTRRALHEALIALVLEKGYAQVTVQDILDRADVSRSAFYAHFRDKDALLLTSFDGVAAALGARLDEMAPGSATDAARPVAVLFEHAHRHRRVYEALCGRQGGNVVQGHLHRLVGGLLREHLRPHLAAAGADVSAEIAAEFLTSAALGLLIWWVDHDFPGDPAGMTRHYAELATPGIQAVLGQPGDLSTVAQTL